MAKKDRIAWITLNRPRALNALSWEMMKELREAADEIAGDDSVRVSVTRGAGRCFGAGGDLMQARKIASDLHGARELLENWHRTLLAVDRCPKIVIAAVQGLLSLAVWSW